MSNYYRTAVYGRRGTALGKGRPNPLVLGRKFCAACGRWRHACDFPTTRRNSRSGLGSYCRACVRMQHKARRAQITPEQRELLREYNRIWADAKRRAEGVPVREFKHRRSVIDRVEWAFLVAEPLASEVKRCGLSDLELGSLAGVPARRVYGLRTGESRHVRLDVADKLALALQIPLWLMYRDAPVKHDIRPASQRTAAV